MLFDRRLWKYINTMGLVTGCMMVFYSIVTNKPFSLFMGLAGFAYQIYLKQKYGL